MYKGFRRGFDQIKRRDSKRFLQAFAEGLHYRSPLVTYKFMAGTIPARLSSAHDAYDRYVEAIFAQFGVSADEVWD